MTEKLTQEVVWATIRSMTGDFHLNDIKRTMNIDPASEGHLRVIMKRLVDAKKIKSFGRKDGYYRIVKDIEPIKWMEADETERFDLAFPYGREDDRDAAAVYRVAHFLRGNVRKE